MVTVNIQPKFTTLLRYSDSLSPFFYNVKIQTVNPSPSVLEFSHCKNISRHFDRELKTLSHCTINKIHSSTNAVSETIFLPSLHLKITCPTKKITNSFALTWAQTPTCIIRFRCFRQSRPRCIGDEVALQMHHSNVLSGKDYKYYLAFY